MLAWGRASFPQAAIPEGGIGPPTPAPGPIQPSRAGARQGLGHGTCACSRLD
jgi:hypothetical protein